MQNIHMLASTAFEAIQTRLRDGLFRATSTKETNLPSKEPFAELQSCGFGLTLHGVSAVQPASPPLSYLQLKRPVADRPGALVLYLEYCIISKK